MFILSVRLLHVLKRTFGKTNWSNRFCRFSASCRNSPAGGHRLRIPATQLDRRVLARQIGHSRKRRAKHGRASLDAVGVGGDEMDEPLFDQRTGELLNLRAECARQTSRGHLQQAAPLDQGAEHAGLVEQSAIAFGMGQNADHAGSVPVRRAAGPSGT